MMSSAVTSVPPRASGRRERKKHITRRELLAAGRRLFGETGLYESSIEDLSRQAGVAKGTLYGYFSSKAELVEAVVTSGFNELLEYCRDGVRGATCHADVVTGVVDAHMRFFADNPDLMRIFHQVRGLLKFGRPEGARLRGVLARHLDGIAEMLAQHYPEAPPAKGELLLAATLLFGAVSGIVSTRASLAGARRIGVLPPPAVNAIVASIIAFTPATRHPAARRRRKVGQGRVPARGRRSDAADG